MSASLVGSEMCIRDRRRAVGGHSDHRTRRRWQRAGHTDARCRRRSRDGGSAGPCDGRGGRGSRSSLASHADSGDASTQC
eukprot:7274211-Alexandrium_andersonii.AAC.1